jgi:hypothetical protein
LTERRNPGCAFGPCNDSKFVGGPGCHLCDDIATLPQKGSGVRVDSNDDTPDGGNETLTLTSEGSTKKAKKGSAPRKSKRGGQSGRLFS